MVDLVELDMVDFDVILGIGWLHALLCINRFYNSSSQVPVSSEPVIKLKSSAAVPKGHFILYLKARNFAFFVSLTALARKPHFMIAKIGLLIMLIIYLEEYMKP
ncbi:hypothetical protein H5410_022599 [Solanum commersonii]|uniref:Uncharacterized protein n=1 Tax=Solanum commersonii TaxID=4109 RepID=A0A9J5ZJI3_SOLCO|nr:hypothetical protein H5410_022599 [Solanum commersonii]